MKIKFKDADGQDDEVVLNLAFHAQNAMAVVLGDTPEKGGALYSRLSVFVESKLGGHNGNQVLLYGSDRVNSSVAAHEGRFYLKDWNENQAIALALKQQEIIIRDQFCKDTPFVPSGFVRIDLWKLNTAKFPELKALHDEWIAESLKRV